MKTPSSSPVKLSHPLLCALLCCAGFSCHVIAASPEATQPSPASKESIQTTSDTAKSVATATREGVGEAWEKSKNTPFKQRETLRERMKAAETSLDALIAEWAVKKDAVKDDSKEAVASAHKEVREAREVLSQKINALDNATEETWSSVKAELNTAWQRMNAAAADIAAKLQS